MEFRLCSVLAVEANVIRDRRVPIPSGLKEVDRGLGEWLLSITDFSATGASDGGTGSAFSSPLCET